MLQEIWKKRIEQHVKTLMKQLRYVFNDHFFLVVVVVLGLSSVSYARWLSQAELLTYRITIFGIVTAILTLATLSSTLATFVHKADQFYLHQQETKWKKYLFNGFIYSLVSQSVYLIALWVVLLPLFITLQKPLSIVFLLTLLCQKTIHLLLIWISFYRGALQKLYYCSGVINALFIGIALWQDIIAFIGSVAFILILMHVIITVSQLDFDRLIDLEQKRQFRNRQFLKLFIDVDNEQTIIKQYRWLEWLQLKTNNPSYFLWQRHLLRHTHYRQLVIRLTIVFMIVGLVIQEPIVIIVMASLMQCLTIIQLVPAYATYQHHSAFLMLPISHEQHQLQFIKVLHHVLNIQIVMFFIYLYATLSILWAFLGVLVLLLTKWGILTLYVRQKLDKMK